jgi:Tol biopolymer transport system component
VALVRGEPAQGEVALLLANADGTAERKLVTHRMRSGVLPGAAWSPDGKIIAYPVNISDESVLHEVRVDDGSEKPISPRRWWRIGQVAWLRDGSGIVMNAIEHASGPTQIWYLSYPDGQAHRITNDLNNYRGVSLTADSSALVTVESEQHSNIWIAPNDNARRAIQITHSKSDGAEGISWTPDGKIVYATRAGGNLDLWITDVDGTRQKQLTANAGNNGGPSVSPDGRYVVFVSDRTGTSHVWRSDIDGSNPRQLTNGDGESSPQCSPDGRWVLYHLRLGKSGIWRVPIDGGEPEQIIEKASGGLSISPDGKWILTAHFEPSAVKSAIYPFEGGEPHKILDIFFGLLFAGRLTVAP